MYRKIAFALIVVGVLVAGHGIFTNSTAHASHCANDNDSAYLAANPELLKVATCSEVTTDEVNVQRAFEADAARYTAMAEYYLAQNETNLQRADEANAAQYTSLASYYAANPELMTVSRYADQ